MNTIGTIDVASKTDFCVGGFFLCAGIVLLTAVIPNQTIMVDDGELAHAFMPSLAAWLFVVFGGALLLRPVAARVLKIQFANPPVYPSPIDAVFIKCLGAGIGVLAVSILSIRHTGYLFGGGITIFLSSLLFQYNRPAQSVTIALVVPGMIYVLVRIGLRLALP